MNHPRPIKFLPLIKFDYILLTINYIYATLIMGMSAPQGTSMPLLFLGSMLVALVYTIFMALFFIIFNKWKGIC